MNAKVSISVLQQYKICKIYTEVTDQIFKTLQILETNNNNCKHITIKCSLLFINEVYRQHDNR